ncbi:MAG: hypothetical protein ABI068_07235 [Ktedonobacterales bacterium]
MSINPYYLYTLVLFVHVSGAIAVFIGLGIWLFALVGVQRAQRVEQVRALASLFGPSGNMVVGALPFLALAGLYMAYLAWGLFVAWIDVATVSFLLLAPFGAFVIDPRIKAISAYAKKADDGAIPAELSVRIHDPLLGMALTVYVAVLLGIVFLMTIKPPFGPSILAMLIALALGLLVGLMLLRIGRRPRLALSWREAKGARE